MKKDKAKYLILGNSTAAVGAVEGIRKIDSKSPIVILSREPYHTYSRPLISHLLAGDVNEDMMYYRSADFYEKNGVDAWLGTAAESVDPGARAVKTCDGKKLPFENLLIATGGNPFVPTFEGRDTEGVFTFTSWDDANAIASYLDAGKAKRALVVGGGLIGIKAAEALSARGLEVQIVERADRVLPTVLDEKGASYAKEALKDACVHIECNTTVERIISENGSVSSAVLKTNRLIPCDIVIIAIGVVPNVGVVKDTAVKIDHGVLIDERCRTTVEGVYAAGDVAQSKDTIANTSRPIPIFPNAYRQGRVAGRNMAGGDARTDETFAMNSIEVFGLPTISLGLATAAGDGYEILQREDDSTRTYKRIVLRDNRIVGALFVGNIERAGIMTGLIRGRVSVSSFKHLLLTDQFGLISLPTDYRKHLVKGEGIEV